MRWQEIQISSEEQVCLNCKHFIRHYAKYRGLFTNYHILHFGHCAGSQRIKNQTVTDCCNRFEAREEIVDEEKEPTKIIDLTKYFVD
jgi:hypothetical protein